MSQISKGKVLDAGELFDDSDTGKLLEVRADWTTEASCADQIGYIDWPSVLRRVRSPSSAHHTGDRISSGSQLPTRPGHRSAHAECVDSETVTAPGDDAAAVAPSRSAYVRACGHRPLAEIRVSASVTNEKQDHLVLDKHLASKS